MPRYFFDVRAVESGSDPDGEDLEGPAVARRSAVLILSELLRDKADYAAAGGGIAVSVRGADRVVWYVVESRSVEG